MQEQDRPLQHHPLQSPLPQDRKHSNFHPTFPQQQRVVLHRQRVITGMQVWAEESLEREKNASPAINTVSDRRGKQEEGCQLF